MTKQNIVRSTFVLFLLLALSTLINTQQVAAQVSSWEASYFNNPSLEGQPVVRVFETAIDQGPAYHIFDLMTGRLDQCFKQSIFIISVNP